MSTYTEGIRTMNSPVSVTPRAAKLIKGKLVSISRFTGQKKTGICMGLKPTSITF